jgi:aldehyde dehydrogenase (NAD+)
MTDRSHLLQFHDPAPSGALFPVELPMSAPMLKALGLTDIQSGTYLGNGEWSKTTDAGTIEALNPSTNEVIAKVHASNANDYETIVKRAQAAFAIRRTTPAPRRG